MKISLRATCLISALAVSTAAVLIGADAGTPRSEDLTVHEWGTFTSVAGEDGSSVDWDVLGGKYDLPSFVVNRGVQFKFRLQASVRMETPVLYFYSQRPLDAQVKVGFPNGTITEWYPNADTQAGGIEWMNIRIEPGTSPVLPHESSPSRYYAARATDASPITVGGQHEKFLFYRGAARVEIPLSAKIAADGSINVSNSGSDGTPLLMLFENRGGRIGYRNAGAVSDSATLVPPVLDGSLPQLYHELENALVAQGLFRKEASAMIETWKDTWFEEGSRLIYIVPSQVVNAMVPLQVNPRPVETTRVFVGRIELITAETKRAVVAAIAANDVVAALPYGRFLDPILQSLNKEDRAMAIRNGQFRGRVQTAMGR